jgi:lipoprotein-anchoring transpeptidase ErfK/SrfK
MAFVLKARRTWMAVTAFIPALVGLLVLAASPAATGTGPPAGGGAAPARFDAQAAGALIPAPPPTEVSAGVGTQAGPRILLLIHRWLKPGEYAWTGESAAAGPLTVAVDLRARTLSVYRGGMEIGRSSIVYGADDKPTPTGRFPILEKDADHVSNLYDNAPMPWMLRLTRDGIAIHGSEMGDDVGTHGCVGLPDPFAKLLFAAAAIGDSVSIAAGPPPGMPYTSYAALPAAAAGL